MGGLGRLYGQDAQRNVSTLHLASRARLLCSRLPPLRGYESWLITRDPYHAIPATCTVGEGDFFRNPSAASRARHSCRYRGGSSIGGLYLLRAISEVRCSLRDVAVILKMDT